MYSFVDTITLANERSTATKIRLLLQYGVRRRRTSRHDQSLSLDDTYRSSADNPPS